MVMHRLVTGLLVIFTASLCCGQFMHGQAGHATVARVGDVVPLSDSTFAAQLADVDLALVKFYAPWWVCRVTSWIIGSSYNYCVTYMHTYNHPRIIHALVPNIYTCVRISTHSHTSMHAYLLTYSLICLLILLTHQTYLLACLGLLTYECAVASNQIFI